ncbi:MAG: sulfurtransferase TusA family protein [Ruthenibacterium sp.]
MNTFMIDASGLSCPQPVILVQKALKEQPEGGVMLVDDRTAKENVLRYAEHAGYHVTLTQDGGCYRLQIEK